jgi:hypothetical protein
MSTLNINVIPTVIATVFASLISVIIALYLNRKNKRDQFDRQLHEIIAISIQYPYLENIDFCQRWDPQLVNTDERYQRYELYCALIFNFLELVARYYNYNKNRIIKILDIEGWIRIHEYCWKKPSIPHENTDGYDSEFKKFVTSVIG